MTQDTNKTIYLVDAYAQIYRGFHALPLMCSSKGEYSNAAFAFSRFLLGLEKDYEPSYGAVVFDLGRPQARLRIHPGYKATRPPMPEELKQQLPVIREIAAAFGYPLFEHENSEADDLLAALCANFADFTFRIITSDKDMSQVVSERVELLVPQSGANKGFERRGVGEVMEKFGVKPSQIVDYLSLIGDTSDNIPGIPGVGPKTAAKLIGEFGSIDGMLSDIHRISNPGLREKIANSADILRKNKELIRLDPVLPEPKWSHISALARKSPDWGKIRSVAEQLELKGFLRDVDELLKKLAEKADGITTQPSAPTLAQSMYTPDLFG